MGSRSRRHLPRRQSLQEVLAVLNTALRTEVDGEEAEVEAESTEEAMEPREAHALTIVVPAATAQVTSAEAMLTT